MNSFAIPVRTLDGEGLYRAGLGLLWQRSNYDSMLLLTPPMAFTGIQTADPLFTKPVL